TSTHHNTPSSLSHHSLSSSLSSYIYKFIIINIKLYFSHIIIIITRIKMTSKTQDYKCCMCGDHGLTQELFRCKVCHFRSQHRYCSNLYPKADSYNVCNWCLIQKEDDNLTTNTIISTNSSSNSSSPSEKRNTKNNTPTTNLNGPKIGPRPTGLQPISPIKKPMMRSPGEARSPSGRKRVTAVHQGPVVAHDQERLRRTKSSVEMSSIKYSRNNNSNSSGGPPVIKHVFRNKVRRYKLLEEVSG
ncbi:hypothetical protein KSS87_013186, partial [Heliosperma pusillum]